MKTLHLVLLSAVLMLASPAMGGDEVDQIHQAASIMHRFRSMPEKQIPRHVLREAKGVAILTVLKGGFIWSGKIGQGVVVARSGHGWTGPSFVKTGGVGFGAQIGGEVTEFVLVLNTPEAVQAFATGGNLELGGALSVAAGPVGRSAEAGVTPTAAVYTYSRSQGLFAGVSLEGTVIKTDESANEHLYHRAVNAHDILRGRVSAPKAANELLASL